MDTKRDLLPYRSLVIRDGKVYLEEHGCGCCAVDIVFTAADARTEILKMETQLQEWRNKLYDFENPTG